MNNLKQFGMGGGQDDNWRLPSSRQNVVAKIDEAIVTSGMPVNKNTSEMENAVFSKAKSREEYFNMIAHLIHRVREIKKTNQNAPNMQNALQNQQGVSQQQVSSQPGVGAQGPGGNQSMATDPINALTNLATQGSRNNHMMNMGGPQGQMQQQPNMGPNNPMVSMQGPMPGQGGPQPNPNAASSLLQTLNHQRPQLNNMQLQGKLGPGMGMVPNQGQMGGQMSNMSGMGSPMGNQMQGQMGQGMQGQMMPNMSMPNAMQVPMSGANTMAGMQSSQMGGMGGQMGPGMQGQMGPGICPGSVGGMGGNQMMQMSMMHMGPRGKVEGMQQMMAGGMGVGGPGYQGPRGPTPGQFLRQSPSPSAPSPAGMGGPSPASMGVMGGAMASPMSVGTMGMGGVGSPAHAASPSAHHGHHTQQQHMQQRGVGGMGMAASPSSSLNTPVGGGGGGVGGASPGGEEAAYREKVRQLSKYIEPLRRMVHRMVSEGENMEKLTKMKNLLDILSNPTKRMPLETLLKCEVVLEKLDFKRSEGAPHPQFASVKEHQIFNPLLEVVNNCLLSPIANHTLKRTFGPTMEALNGPEMKCMPPPLKIAKVEEPQPDIPDVLQGEIARLDGRFKVSLETMQLSGSAGAISLLAHLDDSRLPCVPPVHLSVPRDYPASAPTAFLKSRHAPGTDQSFLSRVVKAMEARQARLPRSCSVGQLLDAWEMSVRQACAPQLSSAPYAHMSALGV